MMLLLGTAMFAVFFFLTIYIQTVWGYSPVKAGLAWVPFPIMLIAINIFVARVLVTKVGVRPLLMAGPLFAGVGFMLLSRLSPTGSYWVNLLGPMVVLSIGMGLMFVPLTLMVVAARASRRGRRRLQPAEHRPAGGRLDRPGRHRDDRLDLGRAHGARLDGRGGRERRRRSGAAGAAGAASIPPAILYHGLTVGFSTGLMIAGIVALSGFAVAIVTTWTPGGFRLRSARHDREPSCDDVLGTCEPGVAANAATR